MVKAPRRDGILWNTVSRMRQRKYVDGQKGVRNMKKCDGGQAAEVIKRKKEGYGNGGKTGVKRIWRHTRC